MGRRKLIIFPKYQQLLEQMGENIKLARKRRKLTTIQVAERAGIARSTLYLVEKGDPSEALGGLDMKSISLLNLYGKGELHTDI